MVRAARWFTGEIRESMTEADVECILERAKERYPDARPRIISDNGPQYIAKDFKAFIRISGMTHVRTAPYYPQSNGKTERWHKTIKSDALRPASPTSLEEARRLMERFVEYYNGVRLHSAIGYIAPLDFMDGKATQIWSERDRKLEQARKLRREAPCEQGARMNTLIPGAPLRSLSPTSIEYQRAQWASRAAKPVRAARFTLDAPDHSGTIPGAMGDILPPGVALTSNLAVIFTLNQYTSCATGRSKTACTRRCAPGLGFRLLPPLSVGEMTLRLYSALNYRQNTVSRERWTTYGPSPIPKPIRDVSSSG